MLAPAQKNFSPAPVMTITCTVVVHARGEHRRVDLLHHLVGVGVGGRIVQLDDGDAVGDRSDLDFAVAASGESCDLVIMAIW